MVTTAAELDAAIREFVRLLGKGLAIEAIVLFGSHACGTAYEDSDIDLAVISPDFEGVPMNRPQEMIADLPVHRPFNLSPSAIRRPNITTPVPTRSSARSL
jgi:hypothetical protein